MGALVITQNITVDGVIEQVTNWFDPGGGSPDLLDEVHRQMRSESVFLVGRKTFEGMRGYWPKQTDDQTGITAHLNKVQKVVVSRTIKDPQWENTSVISSDVVPQIVALKGTTEGDICVTGSIMLCHQLIVSRVVDEFRLFTFPRVLGHGRRLFPDGVDKKLEFVSSKPFKDGTVLMTYRPR
ncbi:MAG: dihydrofolate reductase family protein [Archangium sp.]